MIPLRFETKYERWVVVTILLYCVFAVGIMLTQFSLHRESWFHSLPVVITPVVITVTFLLFGYPQYYEVHEDFLYLRQGLRKVRIPWESVAQLQCRQTASRSSVIFSTDSLVVTTATGKRYTIAVAREDSFLAEVEKHCPNLVRQSFGLGLPFSQPV